MLGICITVIKKGKLVKLMWKDKGKINIFFKRGDH